MSKGARISFDPPSEEAGLLRDTAARFVADRYDLADRARMVDDDPAAMPRHWADFAELGWLAAPVPEAAGGLGLPAPDILPLLQTLGAAMVLEPFAAAMVETAPIIADALPQDEAADALAPLIEGREIAIFADGRARGRATARRAGGGWALSGTLPVVPGAAAARTFWLAAEGEDGPLLLSVPASEADVAPFRMVDGQSAARVSVDGVTVPAEAAYAQASEALARAAHRAAFARLAEASGVIDAMYGATLAYVKERAQFGRPIGSFQALQHRMADMFVAREEALSLAQLAAEAVEGGGSDTRCLLAAAQLKVFGAGRAVSRDAIQLHGGMGVSDGMAVGHLAKRLLVLSQQAPARRDDLAAFRGAA